MITIMCKAQDTISLDSLVPFQGELKKRTKKQVAELAASILADGLLMPFAVWVDNGEAKLLDGHGRLAAIKQIAETDTTVLTQEYPVVQVTADTEEQARKSLLQITSSYGNITKQGVTKFCATIPEYKAPAINRFVHKQTTKRKVEVMNNETIIHISVATDKVNEVMQIFREVPFIKVL